MRLPAGRGLTSTTRGPAEVSLISVWATTPSVRPSASSAARAVRPAVSASSEASAAGNMSPVSMNAGDPPMLLSVMPTTCTVPACDTVSTLTSGPSGSSADRTADARRRPRALTGKAASSLTQDASCSSSSTRRTYMPPHRSTGLTTSG